MYSRKEKQDGSKSSLSQQNDVASLLSMLETTDAQTLSEVKALIHETLSTTKDGLLVHCLLKYYLTTQSKEALNILANVREPHDKHLLDKIAEWMKNENTRYQSLLLFSQLICKQPAWIQKIAPHRIFSTLLSLLKTDMEFTTLTCELFTLVSLLPMIPSYMGSFLEDVFAIFSRLVSWNTKAPPGVPEIYVLHLQVGVYSLFHRLYAMYPCNFLAYLRYHYGGSNYNEENFRVFTLSIKPMLERVRLHPLLVTASKESEKNPKRWKKFAEHDVLVECAKISLDAIEGTSDNTKYRNTVYGVTIGSQNNMLSNESMQYVSISSQSSTVSVTMESSSVVTDCGGGIESSSNLSQACGIRTPPPTLQRSFALIDASKGIEMKYPGAQAISLDDIKVPLDIAVEAKPEDAEVPKKENTVICTEECDRGISETTNLSRKTSASDTMLQEIFEMRKPNDKVVLHSVDAKEDDAIDKEVCEITSGSTAKSVILQEDVRHDTPFCSTTQNLTDEPNIEHEDPGNLLKENEPEADDDVDLLASEQTEIKMETLVQTIKRLRFISQCGPAPEIATKQRSKSCPDISFSQIQDMPEGSITNESVETCDSSTDPPSTAYIGEIASLTEQNSVQAAAAPPPPSQPQVVLQTAHDHIIPIALAPLPVPETISSDHRIFIGSESQNYGRGVEIPFYSTLSPPELLDRHIQLGSEAYLNQLSKIPITSTKNTDWTHFGGDAPADEVAMLQTKISLLHNQLMFERHRREVHGERNRRLLGLAKRSKMQEEYTAALKDQVQLLEKENEVLKEQLSQQTQQYQRLEFEKNLAAEEYTKNIRKLCQENKTLTFQNKNYQGLLLQQKQEIDTIREEYKASQSSLLDSTFDLEFANREINRYQPLEKELTWLAKEHILLQELNQHYKEKLEFSRKPTIPEIEVDLMKDARNAEVKNLKQNLELKTNQLDAARSQIAEYETFISDMKAKLTGQMKAVENLKAVYKDEIMARDDRLTELRKVLQQKEAHILELYHDNEILSEELKTLKSKSQMPCVEQSSSSYNEVSTSILDKGVSTTDSEQCIVHSKPVIVTHETAPSKSKLSSEENVTSNI